MRSAIAGRTLLVLVVGIILSGCVMLRCDGNGCVGYVCRDGQGCSIEPVPARNCTADGAIPLAVEQGACVSVPNVCTPDAQFLPEDVFELPDRPAGFRVETDDASPARRFVCADAAATLGTTDVAFRFVPVGENPILDGRKAEGFGTFAITVSAATVQTADLVVRFVGVPALVAPGETFQLEDEVSNEGTGSTGVVTTLRRFLSTDDRLDPGDTPLGSRVVPVLGALDTSTALTAATIPATTPEGAHFVIAHADADGAVTELDEGNNTLRASVVVTRPDLVVSLLDAPASARPGETIVLGDTTTNHGAAAGSSITAFVLSPDTALDDSDAPLGSRGIPALAVGEFSASSTVVTIPLTTAPGSYFVIARADAAGSITELQEGDNTAVRAITIVATPAPLALTASATPATIAAGQAAQLAAAVTGGVAPFTFAWSPATGLSDATIANPLASPAVSTTYTVLVTDTAGAQASAQVTVTVGPASADLALTKSGSPGAVGVGDLLTYSLTVRNDGPSPATGVTVTDTLPAATRFVSASTGCTNAGGVVTCALGTVPGAADRTVSIVVVPRLPADLAIGRLEVSPDTPVVVGGQLTYTVEVTNFGPETAEDVRLSTLAGGFDAAGAATGPPLDVTLVSAVASPTGSCTAQGAAGSGPVQCELGTLTPGARTTVTVVATPNSATTAVGVAPGSLVNTATVATASNDPHSTSDQDSVASVVLPASGSDLAVTRFEVSPATPVVVDDELTYTIEVTNVGPDPAPDVILTTLSAGFDPATGAASGPPLPVALFSATASPAGSCADVGGIGAGPVQCALGALASGASATVTVVVKTQSPTTAVGAPGGALVNGALVTRGAAAGGPTDPDRRNDGGSVATVVLPLAGADLAVTRLDVSPATPVVVGDELSYTIEVTNFGPDAVPGAQLTTLVSGFDPAGGVAGPPLPVQIGSATVSTGGACLDVDGNGAGPVQCPLGPLARGARATVTLVVTATAATTAVGAPGVLTNAARVTSTGGPSDANPANDDASVESSVLPAAPASLVNSAAVSGGLPDPDPADNTSSATTALRPSLRVIARALPTAIAAGQAAQLSAAATGGVPPYAFAWSPAGGLSDAASAAPVAGPGATTTYAVVVTDAAGATARAEVTLLVEDAVLPVVTIAATDAAAAESGPDAGAFTISRTGPTAAALTVSVTVAGTATSGLDYQAVATSVLIPAGAASTSIPVAPVADGIVEGPETVVVSLGPDPRYLVGAAGTAMVTIEDADETVVTIVATDPEAREPEPGVPANPGVFTITRSGSTAALLLVRFLLGGTTNGLDYEAFPAIVPIPVGQSSVSVVITPMADTLVEGPETVTATLFPDSLYRIGTPSTATVTIEDNAAVVSVIASDSSAAEPAPGAPVDAGTVTFTRASNLGVPLVISYTLGGTAEPGLDYESIPLSVVIPAGQASVSVPMTALTDALAEGPETVTVTLDASGEYVIGTPSATVTIADEAAVVTVVATDPSADEAPLNRGVFTLTRAGNLGVPVTVQFTLGGTAVNGVDYEAVAQSVVIPAGETSVTVVITPVPDGLSEPPETVVLTIGAGPGYAIGASGTATVVILPLS